MSNSVGLHETAEELQAETIDRHRAYASMQEELEAADWYDQRAEAASDAELREILIHNRDEEKEHFVMVLEWLRRRDPRMSEELEKRLFTEGPIVLEEDEEDLEHENEDEHEHEHGPSADGSLGIGSLKGEVSL